MSDKPKVSVVILNYNNAPDTLLCIQSFDSVTYANFDLIVVDNKSTDNSSAVLREYAESNIQATTQLEEGVGDKRFSYLQSDSNGGYGYGNNLGIKEAQRRDSDYVLILNNDTTVEPDFLDKLIDYAGNNPQLGLISSKVLFDDKKRIWSVGGRLTKTLKKPKHYSFKEVDQHQSINEPISYIPGCVWLVPRGVFDHIGLIVEHYFMYFEDVEFCYRLNKHGYKLGVCLESVVYHKVGASSGGRWSSFSIYWMATNWMRFIKENFSPATLILPILSAVSIDVVKWISKGQYTVLWVHLKGVVNGLLQK